MTSFIFIGGDRRMLYAAEKLGNYHLCGFEKLVPCTEQDGRTYDCAVLPPQKSADGINIPCPYSDIFMPYSILGKLLRKGGTVFTGNVCGELERVCSENGFRLVNYLEYEELALRNAALTAEGAVAVAVNESPFSVCGTEMLVTGFGRIAKFLAEYLDAMGGKVTVACRKSSARAEAEVCGYRAVDINDKGALRKAVSEASVIFNTVPAVILGNSETAAMKKDTLYTELASVDGICGEIPTWIKYITARGLPGKVSPIAAGEIIADTVTAILGEERREDYE